MTGWLIVNEYLNTEKFRELAGLFLEAADKCGVSLTKHTNAEFAVGYEGVISPAFDEGVPDFIIFYDKDTALARAFENMGIRVFNSSDAISICDSKLKTAEKIAKWNADVSERARVCGAAEKVAMWNSDVNERAGGCEAADENASRTRRDEYIRMPRTFAVPFTYENVGIGAEADFTFLNIIEEKTGYPMIIKESYSSFGMGVHLAHDREEAISILAQHGSRECIIQEYVQSVNERGAGNPDISASGNTSNKPDAGNNTKTSKCVISSMCTEARGACDVRLQMVGDTCVAAMMRTNDNDYRANITNGGTMSAYTPTDDDIALARSAMKCLGLDFAGIDIMHAEMSRMGEPCVDEPCAGDDAEVVPVFLEANSNAHFKNLYDLTGINAAENIIRYISANI